MHRLSKAKKEYAESREQLAAKWKKRGPIRKEIRKKSREAAKRRLEQQPFPLNVDRDIEA